MHLGLECSVRFVSLGSESTFASLTKEKMVGEPVTWSERVVPSIQMSYGCVFLGVTCIKPIRESSAIPFKTQVCASNKTHRIILNCVQNIQWNWIYMLVSVWVTRITVWNRAGGIKDELITASQTVRNTYIAWDPGAMSCANNLLAGYILQKHSVQHTHAYTRPTLFN